MADPPDSLMHELIGLVRENTEKTIAVRSDVNKSVLSIYQIITRIERALDDESKERPTRQKELDRKIEMITTRLDKQDTILERQDQALDVIYTSQRWRGYVLLFIAVLLFIGIAVLMRG